MKKEKIEEILEFINNDLSACCVSKKHISDAVFESAILISNSFPREADISLSGGKPGRTEFYISVYLQNTTEINLLLEWCKKKYSWIIKLYEIVE